MRRTALVMLSVLVLVLAGQAAWATTYYVATGGSDSADGSSGTPWATVQHAVGSIANGDTVIVRAGTFAGCRITTSGASGSPKTLRAETVGATTLNNKSASATHNGILEIENANYWTIDGFVVDGVSHTYRCIDVRTTDHITVRNCTAHDAYATGIFTAFSENILIENCLSYSNAEHGVYCSNSADNGIVRNNVAYGMTGCGIQFNADASMGGDGIMSNYVVEKNTSYGNGGGAGLNCDGLSDSKILNNLLYNNSGSGMALFAIDATSGSSRNLVYNNTVLQPSTGRWAIVIPPGGAPDPTGNKIKNNILYNASGSKGSISIYAPSVSGFESDYNVVVDRFSADDDSSTINLAAWRGYGYDAHSVISNPTSLFVDPGTNDYHLAAGSPAINAGTTLAEVTTDKDGNTRPQSTAYDIGCYEGSGGPAPLNVTTTSLSNGQVNIAYSATLYASGGSTPYTWSRTAGSLPAGLTLTGSTGVISGTPTTAGTSNFTVRVTDNVSATDDQALSITINPSGGLLPHPRIWLNQSILNRMQAAKNANSAEWLALKNWCDSKLGQNMPAGYNFLDWYACVMNYGLAFQVTGNQSYGNEGVKYLTAVLRDKPNIGDGLGGATAITTDSGYVARSIGTAAAVGRDWLNGASNLTPALINECAARLNDWITWYNASGYSRTDPTDNYYSGYFTMVYTAAIGLEGDSGYQSSWQTQAESMWTTVVAFMNNEGAGADWLEGWNYGPWSVREYIGYPFALETGTTRNNHWSEITWAADLVKSHVHMLYPSRGYFQDNGSWSGNYKGDPRTAVCLMASIMSSNNATTRGLAVWFTKHLTWQQGGNSEWEGLLYTDSSIAEVAPTAANMGGLAYLMYGHSVARSDDWSNLNATYVDVIGRPVDGEGELNIGEVKIGSRGHILVIDGNTYEYTSDMCNVPDITGSHIYAPLQEWWHPGVTFNMDNVDSAYTYSKVSGIQTCYDGVNGENPDTSYFRRDVAFLRPDFVAVFDNITTASTSNLITEKWYLAGSPTINGATASITLGGAKLYTSTVSPAVTVTSAANAGSRTPSYSPNEGMTSITKLLVSPSTPSTSNKILQLFEAAPSTQGSMTACDTLTPTGFLGVHIKHAANPRVAIFATAQNAAETSCSFSIIPVAQTTKVLIIGMQASTNFSVSVTDGGGGSKNVTVATGSGYTSTAHGALSFDVTTGGIPTLVINTTSLPSGVVGTAYSQTLQATGGVTPYTWSVFSGSLPAGLTLAPSTGIISGTPTTANTSNFTIRVTDSQTPTPATDDQALSIVVNSAPQPLNITTTTLPNGTVGTLYSQTLAATGGITPYSWSVLSGSLPAGLSLAPSTGVISGTPTSAGTANFTIRVTDSQTPTHATDDQALSITVTVATLNITTSSLPGGTVGAAYSQTLAATGGVTPYTWSVLSGSLPAGLSLAPSTGVISGTPTAVVTSNFTVRVTDSQSPTHATDDQALSIAVTATTLTITTTSLPNATVNTAYSQTLAATGGVPPYTWSVLSGSLQSGLSLASSTGVISGMPTTAATSNFTVRVTDSQTPTAATDDQALSITVDALTATYYSTASDTEESTTNTAFQTKATLQFTPTASDTWLILAFAEYRNNSISYATSVRMTVDGTAEGLANMMPGNTNEYLAFATSKVATLSAAQHTITVDYASSNAAGTSYIRRARIIALRKASLEMYSNAADTEAGLTATLTDYATVTFTPAAAGDYLMIFSAESMGQWSWRTFIDARLNGNVLDEGQLCSKADTNFDSFASFCVANLPASPQTVALSAYKEGAGWQNIRRMRVAAIRLSDGRLSAFSSAADDTSTGTSSTAFVQKLSKTWASGSTGNWLLLGSGRLNPTGSAMADAQAQYNDTTTLATVMRAPQAPNEWKNFSYGAVQAIVAGSRQHDIDFKSDAAGSTTNMKYAHVVMLPLDSGAAPLTVTTSSLPNGQIAVAYSQTLAATGGTTPYTWSMDTGSLPAGLSLSSGGVISGTPTTAGTANFTVKVTDAATPTPATATKALSIYIPVDLSVTTASVPNGQIAVAYSQTLAATGGTTPYSWSLASGTLPTGLSLSAGGVISGTPTTAGTFSFTARVTDSQTPADTATKALSITIPTDLSITTSSLPNGQIAVFYSQTLVAAGGVTPYSWSLASGSLPTGLSLSSGGVISGTPTAAGTASFTVRVADSQTPNDTATKALSISIPADLSITTASVPNGQIGVAYSQTLAATGGVTPYTWSLASGSLPAGLSLSSGGVISGTPTTAATSNFTVQVADSQAPADTATKALSITIPVDLSVTTASLPNGTVGVAYSQTLAAAGGVTPYSWSLSSGSLPAGLSLSSGGVISGTPTTAATSNFTVRVTDSQSPADTATKALSITIDASILDLVITTVSVPNGQIGVAYSQTLAATGGVTPYTWSLNGGSLPAGLSLSSGGVISGTPTTAVTSSFTVRVTDSQSTPDTDDQALSITIPVDLSITTASLPNGQIGVSYSQTLAATGGVTPYSWSLSSGSLPAGLSLSSGGVISGTPTTAGTANFTARVADSQTPNDTAIKALSITIPADLSVTTASLLNGQIGVAYNQTLAATGGVTPYSWTLSSGSLPAGLSLSSGGVISGTPTTATASSFTVQVADSQSPADTATKALSITIPADLSVTTSSLPNGTVAVAYSQTLAATGGVTPYTWSLSSGSLPAGLSLSTGGVISGTPTTAATSNFTVQVADSQAPNDTATKALSITIGSGSTSPTYQTASADAETSTTSTSFVNKVTLQWTPDVADTWLIFAFAEYRASAIDYLNSVRMQVDGTVEGLNTMMVKDPTEYYSFAVSKVTALTAAQHTITIDFCTANAAQTTYIRRARIVAIRKASLEMYSNAADTEVGVNTTPTDFAPVTFTPATAGDYLLVYTAESMGQWSNRMLIQAKLGATILDECDIASRADVNYDSFAGFCVATLPATSQTAKITATAEGAGIFNIRRLRVAAIRLTGGRFADYSSAADDTQTGTASTSFVQKLSKPWTSGGVGTWLLLAGARLNGTEGQAAEAQMQYNDTTTLASPRRLFQAPNEWKNASSIAVQTIAAGGRQQDVDYRSGNASYTVNVKYAHVVMLPLETGIADLVVTTASLPNGQQESAYSQTLAATGGVTPYTWSLLSGSLPAGLSLSSGGVISGMPTTAQTANFTVRVTDSQGTPDTADKALSITIAAAPSKYEFSASDTESSTTSTSWQTKTTLTFTPTVADTWLILGFAEYKGSSTSYDVRVRTVVDAATVSDVVKRPNATNDYITYSTSYVTSLSAASHTVTLDYSSSSTSGTARIRNARIVAIRKSALEMFNASADSTVALTTTMTNYATLNFTPATAGDYLLIWTAETSARTGYSTDVHALYNAAVADAGYIQSKANTDYVTFSSFAVKTCAASQQTINIAAAKQSGSGSAHNIRRCRLAAIRLTGGRFAGYQSAAADTTSTTTSTTFQNKLTKSWSVGTAGNWLTLASGRLTESSTSYSAEALVQLDDTTTSAQPLRRDKATTDNMDFGSVDLRNLATGTRKVDVDFRSSSTSGTAGILYVHFVALPM